MESHTLQLKLIQTKCVFKFNMIDINNPPTEWTMKGRNRLFGDNIIPNIVLQKLFHFIPLGLQVRKLAKNKKLVQ